jgi:hypothetical protein
MFCWFTEAKPQPGVDNTSSYKIIRRCGPPECRFGRCRMRRAQHRCRSRTASNKRACKMQPVVIGEGGSCRGRRLSRGASDVSSAKSGTALLTASACIRGRLASGAAFSPLAQEGERPRNSDAFRTYQSRTGGGSGRHWRSTCQNASFYRVSQPWS